MKNHELAKHTTISLLENDGTEWCQAGIQQDVMTQKWLILLANDAAFGESAGFDWKFLSDQQVKGIKPGKEGSVSLTRPKDRTNGWVYPQMSH